MFRWFFHIGPPLLLAQGDPVQCASPIFMLIASPLGFTNRKQKYVEAKTTAKLKSKQTSITTVQKHTRTPHFSLPTTFKEIKECKIEWKIFILLQYSGTIMHLAPLGDADRNSLDSADIFFIRCALPIGAGLFSAPIVGDLVKCHSPLQILVRTLSPLQILMAVGAYLFWSLSHVTRQVDAKIL